MPVLNSGICIHLFKLHGALDLSVNSFSPLILYDKSKDVTIELILVGDSIRELKMY
jgi:hypothetical protein